MYEPIRARPRASAARSYRRIRTEDRVGARPPRQPGLDYGRKTNSFFRPVSAGLACVCAEFMPISHLTDRRGQTEVGLARDRRSNRRRSILNRMRMWPWTPATTCSGCFEAAVKASRCPGRSMSIRILPPRYGDDLVQGLAVRRTRLRVRQARRLPHGPDRRLSGRTGPRPQGKDPRLPQHLPPSRQPCLFRRARVGGAARLPVSPVEL